MSTKSRDALRKGSLVAQVLAGSWRSAGLPDLEISETELDAVTPLLYDSGTAALGWHRVSKTQLKTCSSAEVLHQAYRLQSLQSEIHAQKIEKVFRLLRQAQVEAVLAKGWATAGMYTDRALRPYGDIDISVHPRDFKRAEEVLSVPEANDCWVDLHQHFSEIDERSVAELFARSRTADLGGEQIRLLGFEDQLALSCIHLLKHGAWRPLWLCDVGVMIESLPANFDWEICLGNNPTRANWIICAIGLAKRLLRADTEGLPAKMDVPLPEWLLENVLRQWERPFAIHQPPMSHPVPIADLLRHPSGLIGGLRQRWPNAIIATISVNGEFNNLPRLPYQMANCLSRIGRLLLHSLLNSPTELREH
ncbi:MAG TPA: nucleotidyltransferase family protein [Pyrinomonadaceae bacterium]|nr:nucleotidyltransferase family protein [Pyrinomonadaceae bacterium]